MVESATEMHMRERSEASVIRYQLLVNRTVGQARRLPIQGMASGSACPTTRLSGEKRITTRESTGHGTEEDNIEHRTSNAERRIEKAGSEAGDGANR